MTTPALPSNRPVELSIVSTPGYEDIAVSLSQSLTPLDEHAFVNAIGHTTAKPNSPSTPTLPRLMSTSLGEDAPPAAAGSSCWHRQTWPRRERFAGDPRDDVRLHWADEMPTWWHFDVEARMVERETLWITEKVEELFRKYLKPVWWDRFVEGIDDFLSMITKELLNPVWTLLTAPIRAITRWIPEVEWPWNFELRGANVSLKQSPFRRLVCDSRLASTVVDQLWNNPDEFLEAGQIVMQDDFGAAARVPIQPPTSGGPFQTAAVGLLKRFNLRGVTHMLTRLLLFTRGSRSWTYGRELRAAGINTPRPLAMVEDRVGPLRLRSFVLTESAEGTPLPEFLATTTLSSVELDQLAGQFARIWHRLGELRLVHGAMHASNFLVTKDQCLQLINLDGMWRHWFDATFLHRRDRDWLRFMSAWRDQPEIGAAFRAAVARHFANAAAVQSPAAPPLPLRWQRAA